MTRAVGSLIARSARPMSPGSRVGLVTVTYSPGDSLAAPAGLAAGRLQPAGAVVLADNGSTDGSVETAAARPGVRLLRTGSNLGYGGAANAGRRRRWTRRSAGSW